jgi:hypothetical protein
LRHRIVGSVHKPELSERDDKRAKDAKDVLMAGKGQPEADGPYRFRSVNIGLMDVYA